MSRINELLLAAASDCDEMMHTLDGNFIQRHDVASDECFDLMESVAFALRAWVAMDATERAVAMTRVELGPEVANALGDSLRLATVTQRLKGTP